MEYSGTMTTTDYMGTIFSIEYSNTSPSECLFIHIILKNEPLHHQTFLSYGSFEESFLVNGRKSWKNVLYSNAIWYMPNNNQWKIADIKYTGEDFADLYAIDQFSGLTDSRNQWHYYDYLSKTHKLPPDPNDITVMCTSGLDGI